MSSNSSRYGLRRSGGQHGDVFTSPEVVSYMGSPAKFRV